MWKDKMDTENTVNNTNIDPAAVVAAAATELEPTAAEKLEEFVEDIKEA
jgi:hypothetical protein